MTFEKRGYLSPEMTEWTKRIRAEEAPHFALADDVSDLGVQMTALMEGKPKTLQNMFICAYYLRALQSLQGAICMAERGMYTEARTLCRTTFETLFYMAAALREPEFCREVAQHHVRQTNRLLDAHSQILAKVGGDAAAQAQMLAAQAGMNAAGMQPKDLKIFDVARRAGLEDTYRSFYAGLSSDASHPGLMALNGLWDKQGEAGWQLQWGPDYYRIETLVDTLRLISLAGMMLIEHFNEFIKSTDIHAALVRLSDGFKKLYAMEEATHPVASP